MAGYTKGASAVGRVPDEVVERVRAEADLIAVAERLTGEQFKRATATEWAIRCPYPDHEDKSPSFHVSTEKPVYLCRGCGKTGDAIRLVRDIRGASFAGAVEFVAGVMGIEVPAGANGAVYAPPAAPPRARRRRPKKKPPEPVEPVGLKRGSLEEVYRRSVGALPGSIGERYLVERRRMPADLVRLHGLGYAPPGQWPYDDAWRARKGEKLRHLWEHGRIVFPHTRPDGSVVNLYGRAVGEAERLPPERREAFGKLKHRHLSGNRGYFNAPALTHGRFPGGEALIVCEGPLDALAVIATGHERTVAILGVNGWRPEWLPSDVSNLVFAMDADAAGDVAWRKIAEHARRMGVRVTHLTADAYGGEKDAAAAYAKGVLDLGELPVAPKRPARTKRMADSEEERARRRADAEAAMERALKEAKKEAALDVLVVPAAEAPAARVPSQQDDPKAEFMAVPTSQESDVGTSERSPTDAPVDAPKVAQPEEDNVVDLHQYALEALKKRRAPTGADKEPRGGEE